MQEFHNVRKKKKKLSRLPWNILRWSKDLSLIHIYDIYREVYESQTSGGGDFDEKEGE